MSGVCGGGDAVGHGSSGPPEGGSGAAGHGSQMPFLPTGGLGGVNAGPWGLVGGGGVRAPMAWPAATGHFQAPTAWPSAIGTGQPAAAASLRGFSYLPHPAAPFAMYGGQFMPGPPPYGIQQAIPQGPFLINNHFGSSASWFLVHPLHHGAQSIPQGASCYGPLQSLHREVSDKPLPDTEGLVASNNGIGNGPQCNSSSAPMAEASSGESDSEFGDATAQVSIPSAIPEQNVVPTPLGDCGCVPSSPGYRKRTRLPKGVIPPDCRQPRKKMEPTEGGGGQKKPKGAAAPPAMASIGDDVLGDIFLRLPDTATLARAALACKRWRRVASDPALLRRFHSVHGPPPLLGFIMSGPPPRAFAVEGPDRRFLPAPSRNPHLNAAAAAAIHFEDFAAKNPRSGSVIDEWLLRGYDSGRLLLSYRFIEYEQLAVYDPIGRTTDLVCRPDIMQFDFEFVAVHYALLVDEADASFQVVGAQFWNGLIRAAVFSSRTGEWAPLPSLRAPEPWRMRGGMRAGRFAYWQSNTRLERCFYSDELERSLVLDTTTKEWTLIQVPFPAKESYCVADMAEHGGLCLVSSKDQIVQLWVCDNNGGWVIKKQVSLLKQFGLLKKLRHDEWMKRVRILAVRDGYVYMEFWSIRKPNSYLLVLNWETMKLSVFANDTTNKYRGPAFPFFMTWAPPLLSPAEEQRLCLQGHD